MDYTKLNSLKTRSEFEQYRNQEIYDAFRCDMDYAANVWKTIKNEYHIDACKKIADNILDKYLFALDAYATKYARRFPIHYLFSERFSVRNIRMDFRIKHSFINRYDKVYRLYDNDMKPEDKWLYSFAPSLHNIDPTKETGEYVCEIANMYFFFDSTPEIEEFFANRNTEDFRTKK